MSSLIEANIIQMSRDNPLFSPQISQCAFGALPPQIVHSDGLVAAQDSQGKMAFEEASRLLDPVWRDGSRPVAPLSTALVQRA